MSEQERKAWHAVHVTTSKNPNDPVAVFAPYFAGPAKSWADKNYPRRNEIRPCAGPPRMQGMKGTFAESYGPQDLPESELIAMEEKGEAICKMAGMHSFDKTPNGKLVAEVRRLRAALVSAPATNPERMATALEELVTAVNGGRKMYGAEGGEFRQIDVSTCWLDSAREYIEELRVIPERQIDRWDPDGTLGVCWSCHEDGDTGFLLKANGNVEPMCDGCGGVSLGEFLTKKQGREAWLAIRTLGSIVDLQDSEIYDDRADISEAISMACSALEIINEAPCQ